MKKLVLLLSLLAAGVQLGCTEADYANVQAAAWDTYNIASSAAWHVRHGQLEEHALTGRGLAQ